MSHAIARINTPEVEGIGSPPDAGPSVTPNASSDMEIGAGVAGSKVMIVDDHAISIQVIQAYLEDVGYTDFVTTSDSTQAIELLSRECPDVVLLDINMPEVSGFEILGEMRARPEFQHVPVVILTSAEDAETKLKALKLGANDFLAKPADPSELALRLRNTLAAKAYQDHLTYFDALTNLPNRRLFMERLHAAVSSARENGTQCAVVHLNLDRFKQINDTHGHSAGDVLLNTVAKRLGGSLYGDTVRGTSTRYEGVSRTGGDEFAILVSKLDSIERITTIARTVLRELACAIHVGGQEFYVGASIGIAIFPDDSEDAETLFKHATIAMSHAKRKGGKRYEFFSTNLNLKATERLKMESELHRALDQQQLRLFYQPKVDVRTGCVVGAEALLRWQHPELGMITPAEFIPIAEENGLIEPFGEWVLHEACKQNAIWQHRGLGGLNISVNVASRQFRDKNLLVIIHHALRESGLDPSYLTVEITESSLMERVECAVEMLSAIRSLGVNVSIDDFGTGYSSLSYLEDFPVDELKVDRSFLRKIKTDDDDAPIVNAIIGMAHSLELNIVAEGVETQEQLRFLRVRRCDEYQGFLFSNAVEADKMAALAARHVKAGKSDADEC